MAYLVLDDGFDENPKLEEISDAAFRAYVRALCYAGRNLTDGHLPARRVQSIAAPKVLRELVAANLWEKNGDGGYVIHDYLAPNRSKAQVIAAREATKKRVDD